MSEEYVITETPFSIDIIETYLLNTKNMLIKMNILLDTYEINKCLANSLNRALLKNDVDIDSIYTHMSSNWEEVSTSVPTIEDKIRTFNKSQNYEYYVDMEDVFYLVFYKQIEYVKKILMETMLYLNSNVNLIFIYTFVIQAFYDEPTVFSNNYIFILNKLVNNGDYGNVQTVRDFFAEAKIKKLGYVLTLLYNADTKLMNLVDNIRNDKITFIKLDIRVPIDKNYNNFNCINKGKDVEEETLNIGKSGDEIVQIEKKSSNSKMFNGTRDIEIIEKEFSRLKCNMLFEKRDITIDKVYEGLQHLLTDDGIIIRELWLGVMLFLYKKYTFNFEEFQKQVTQLLKSNNYAGDYIPSTDTFKDLDLPVSIYVTNQSGGTDKYLNNYLNKYLKYKAKYLNLKKNKNKK